MAAAYVICLQPSLTPPLVDHRVKPREDALPVILAKSATPTRAPRRRATVSMKPKSRMRVPMRMRPLTAHDPLNYMARAFHFSALLLARRFHAEND